MDLEVTCTGLSKGHVPDPCIVVIFGITGDLARHDLIPSLFALECQGLLPDRFAVAGFARRDWQDDDLRQEMQVYVSKDRTFDENTWSEFAGRMHYVRGDFNAPAQDAYVDLRKRLKSIQNEHDIPGNVLFHLSTPPAFYGDIMQRLGEAGLLDEQDGWRRVIIEKPFGHDEQSARQLDGQLIKVIGEEQLYRVDHYLGKETVQNMLVFRFANPSFEPIWNQHYIDRVEITAAESEGIGTRGDFYEQTGVVRDMVQNHLLQLLCMTAMEPPVSYEGTALRDETVKVLRSLRTLDLEKDCVLGQYGSGKVNDESVAAYRDEEKVAAKSTTPTFAQIRLYLDNWRWAGVPFILRTGKRLKEKLTSICIHFKPTPHLMFPVDGAKSLQPSILTFRLQPDEGIHHTFLAKQPGPDICLRPVTMHFRYDQTFGIDKMPGAYQWLLLDAMQGDQTLFPRSDWIYEAWSLIDPLVSLAENNQGNLQSYAAGSTGPANSDQWCG